MVCSERHVRSDAVRPCSLLVRIWNPPVLVQAPQTPQRDSWLLGPHVSLCPLYPITRFGSLLTYSPALPFSAPLAPACNFDFAGFRMWALSPSFGSWPIFLTYPGSSCGTPSWSSSSASLGLSSSSSPSWLSGGERYCSQSLRRC